MLILGILITVAAAVLGVMTFLVVRQQRLATQNIFDNGGNIRSDARDMLKKMNVNDTSKMAMKLRNAGLELAPRSWIILLVAASVLVCLVVASLFGNIILGILSIAGVYIASVVYLNIMTSQRKKAFGDQLPRALSQIASAVRSGSSLPSAIRTTGNYMDDPIKGEFRKLSAETAVGDTTLAQALFNMASRTKSREIQSLAVAVKTQEETGGELASTLDIIAESATMDLDQRRELKTETASSKVTLLLVAIIMPLLVVMMCLANKSFLAFYTTNPIGWAVIAFGVIAEIVGIVISRKLMKLKEI